MTASNWAQQGIAPMHVAGSGVRLAVFEHGDPAAETLVLVHGWPDTHAVWDYVVPLLAEEFHVVTYDTRGHGGSPLLGSKELFTLELLAEDAVAVAQAVSNRPVHLVAHDWGSIQSWEAVCRPDAAKWFASFTSISGPSLDHAAMWLRGLVRRPTPRNLGILARQAVSSSYIYFFLIPRIPEVVLAALGRRLWPRFLKATEGLAGMKPAETLTGDMIAGVRLYRANMLRRLIHPNPRRSPIPLQLVVNSKDIAMTPAMFDRAADWTVDLTRVDLDRGHWLPVSEPQLVADLVTNFVRSRGENDV